MSESFASLRSSLVYGLHFAVGDKFVGHQRRPQAVEEQLGVAVGIEVHHVEVQPADLGRDLIVGDIGHLAVTLGAPEHLLLHHQQHVPDVLTVVEQVTQLVTYALQWLRTCCEMVDSRAVRQMLPPRACSKIGGQRGAEDERVIVLLQAVVLEALDGDIALVGDAFQRISGLYRHAVITVHHPEGIEHHIQRQEQRQRRCRQQHAQDEFLDSFTFHALSFFRTGNR